MSNTKLLSVTEAAIHLGITKELLFAYIRNAPKKNLGEDRKLNTVEKNGQNYFTEEELISFDTYLKQPWSKSGEPRPAIPSYIKEYLKVEIGGKCPIASATLTVPASGSNSGTKSSVLNMSANRSGRTQSRLGRSFPAQTPVPQPHARRRRPVLVP